jgi:FK506-binding nuclear protein
LRERQQTLLPSSIHLFGNYVGMCDTCRLTNIGIEKPSVDQAPLPTDLPPDFSDEESVDLRDVSSDVEMNPDDIDGLDDSDDEEYVHVRVSS